MNKLIIIGAGGHGKVIADIAVKNGYSDISFLDDNATQSCMSFPIVGGIADIEKYNDAETGFVIAIGSNGVRKAIADKYAVNWVTLVHPSAQVSIGVKLGKGTVVMANAAINADVVVGKHCIVNTGAVVEHDSVLENYVHISPGATLGGTVRVGEGTHIGIGATVKNNIAICKNCIIGAGAVVVKDITESSIYVGVPAKQKNNQCW